METSYIEETAEPGRNRTTRDFLVGFGITMAVFAMFVLAQNFLLVQVWSQEVGISSLFSSETLEALTDSDSLQQILALAEDGDAVSHVSLYGGLVGLATLFLLIGLWRSQRTKEILGLQGFSLKHGLIFLVGFVLVLFLQQAIATAAGIEIDFMEKVMGSVTNKTLMLLGIGIMAPLFEELWLRGIAYWSVERISDNHTAILVTSIAFALLHIQYPWPVIVSIIPLGIILGYARSVSGSIYLPILLHVINNCMSVLFYEQLS